MVTILCCGVHPTAASGAGAELDVLHSQMRALYRLVRQEVEHYGGTIQPITGNRFLVLFGAPLAQEDHAQRAVLAALGLQQQLNTSNNTRQTPPQAALAVRLGLHTGEVALGGFEEDQAMAAAVVGNTALLATALQEAAEPGTMLSSAVTIRLIEGLVHIEPAPPMPLAGQSTPLRVYKVLRRVSQQAPGPLRPRPVRQFVGRRHELATLRQRFEQVAEGRGQVVGITGEPGIGKSRLLTEFRQWLRRRPVTYLEGYCWSYGWGTPYGPVLAIVRQACGVSEIEPHEVIARQVHQILEELGMVPAAHAPYLLHLLGVQSEPERLSALPAEEFKARIYATLQRLAGHLARRQPLVVAIEDLHWSDATSEALLTSLVEHIAGAPILLVATYRPEYHPAWLDKSYATQLTLQPLTARDSRRLLQEALPAAEVSDTLVQRLLAQADGNPFFVEELGRTVVEHGASSPSLAVPSTIHAVLMARIDRLPPAAKQLLQVAAVIGKDVPISMLEAVAEFSAKALYESLEHLQGAEFLYETQLVPTSVHTFKHVLTQEVAYQSLLPSTRQPYHQRSAQVLTERFPETAAVHPGLLAHHYTEAGMEEQAIPYWQQAGQMALERSANSEAVSHFTKGLHLLKALPVTLEHIQRELTLQLAIGAPLLMLKGHTAPEVEHAYARAHELAQHLGETSQHFSVLVGLWRFYLSRAQFHKARELGEQCFTLAQHVQDPALLQEAHLMLGSVLLYMGDLLSARAHLEQGMTLYDPERLHSLTFSRATNPGVVGLSRLAWTLWLLGYPDSALIKSHEALRLAEQSSHSYNIVYARYFAAIIHQCRREVRATQEQSEAMIALSREHRFVLWLAEGSFLYGWTLAQQEVVEEGIVQMRQSRSTLETMGLEVGHSSLLIMLAEVYCAAGQTMAGKRTLAETHDVIHKNAEHYYEAELSRLTGELLLQESQGQQMAEAEAHFQQALSLARRQGAKSLELRATMSLSRLWQRQGKGVAARDLLAETYSWFTEGFDTINLQEAKALLAALQ